MDPFDDGFTSVYSKTTGKKQRVPKHFVGHPVLGRNITVTPQVRDSAPYPDGDPTTEWKADQLQAYADAQSIDLTGAKGSKADMVAAINTALAAANEVTPTFDTTPNADGNPPSDETPA